MWKKIAPALYDFFRHFEHVVLFSFVALIGGCFVFAVSYDLDAGKFDRGLLKEITLVIFASIIGSLVRFISRDGSYSSVRDVYGDQDYSGVIVGRIISVVRSVIISAIVYCIIKSKLLLFLIGVKNTEVIQDLDAFRLILIGFACGLFSSRLTAAMIKLGEKGIDGFERKVPRPPKTPSQDGPTQD